MPLRKNRKSIKNVNEIEKFATSDKKEHQKYVESINEAIEKNSISATNIMSFMLQEI